MEKEFILQNFEKNDLKKIVNEISLGIESAFKEDEYYPTYTTTFLDKDGNRINDFYNRCLLAGLESELKDLVKKITRLNNAGNCLWHDDESLLGLDIAYLLVLENENHLKLFTDYIASANVDGHDSLVSYFNKINEKYGWNRFTYSLLFKIMFESYLMFEYFPQESLIKKLKVEDEYKLFMKVLEEEEVIYGDTAKDTTESWVKALDKALLPNKDDIIKIDVKGKKIALIDNLTMDREKLINILKLKGAEIVDNESDADFIIKKPKLFGKKDKIIKFDQLVEIKALQPFIDDINKQFSRLTSPDTLVELDNFFNDYYAFHSDIDILYEIFTCSLSLDYKVIEYLLKNRGLAQILTAETDKHYFYEEKIYACYGSTDFKKTINLLHEYNAINYSVDMSGIKSFDDLDEKYSSRKPIIMKIIDDIRVNSKLKDIEEAKDKINLALNGGANLEEVYYEKYNKAIFPLQSAINKINPNYQIIDYLIELGANINQQTASYTKNGEIEWIKTPILEAIEKSMAFNPEIDDDEDKLIQEGAFALVKKLIEMGADITQTDDYIPFFKSLETNNVELIKYLHKIGNYDLNGFDKYGNHIITYASNAKDSLLFLLDNGTDINGKNSNGETAIYRAALFAKIDVMELLIKRGIDLNSKNNSGLTLNEFIKYEYENPGSFGANRKKKRLLKTAEFLGIEL